MLSLLRNLARNIPTLLFAFLMAVAVWVISVTQADPSSVALYPRQVDIEVIGQEAGTVLTGISPRQVSVRINAPQSVWNVLNSEPGLVTADVVLSGLGPGTHQVRVEPHVLDHPATIVSHSPEVVTVTIEKLATQTFPVHLVTVGEPSIGYQAGIPELNAQSVTVSGPASLVSRVKEVRATLDLTDAHENIARTITLQPLDMGEALVSGVTLTPEKISLSLPITQRFGFRTVSVKVVVTGQVASGYRVTFISVNPVAVVVSSANPQLVNNLPGFVETMPVSMDGAKNDIEVNVPLNLPDGVKVEGEPDVLVQVGITAIESNLTLHNLAIETTGLPPELSAAYSPATVDIILSGPLPALDTLRIEDVHVIVDLTGKTAGTYQVTPTVKINNANELRVISIQPGSLEATVGIAPSPTPTRRP